ncbi:hypothetical protein LTR28_013114, partial [Elasticomyces elasticus]
DRKVVLAFEEGHDADIPSNEGVYSEKTPTASSFSLVPGDAHRDLEKCEPKSSSLSSVTDGTADEPAVTTTPTELQDPFVVWWDEPASSDPSNPMNWSTTLKFGNIGILSFLTLVTPLASSMFAPGVPEVMREFNTTSETLATFVVSVYLMGFAFGPLVIAPMSELYGRLPVYHSCTLLFIILTVACALATNMNMLIGFRFLEGVFGACPITIGAGSIADMMPQEKRGGAMAIWIMGPLLGPVIGPVAGGYLSNAMGWRWVFWIIAIVSGASLIVALLTMRETYAPTLLKRKAARLRKETGKAEYRSRLDSGLTPRDFFVRAIVRPSKMLVLSPIVAIMSTYMAFVYGILYLLFTTFTFVFEDAYGFTQSNVGLVYIGIGVGMLLGLAVLGSASDKIAIGMAKSHNNGVIKPEYRLPALVPGGFFVPVGLFLYGWAAEKHVQWAVPLLGTLLVGIGIIVSFMCVQTYLVDAFT